MLTNDQIIHQLESILGITSIHMLRMFGTWNCSCEYQKTTLNGVTSFKGEFKGRDDNFTTALRQMYDGLMQFAGSGIPDFGAPMLELQADEHEVAKRDIEG